MSITFCIESRSEREDRALESEGAPVLNVHNAGGFSLLDRLGYELDHYGTVDAADLIARIDAAAPTVTDDYLAARLPRLRAVAVAARNLDRLVVWG